MVLCKLLTWTFVSSLRLRSFCWRSDAVSAVAGRGWLGRCTPVTSAIRAAAATRASPTPAAASGSGNWRSDWEQRRRRRFSSRRCWISICSFRCRRLLRCISDICCNRAPVYRPWRCRASMAPIFVAAAVVAFLSCRPALEERWTCTPAF